MEPEDIDSLGHSAIAMVCVKNVRSNKIGPLVGHSHIGAHEALSPSQSTELELLPSST